MLTFCIQCFTPFCFDICSLLVL